MCHFVTYWDRGNEVSAESGGIRPKICRVREGQRMTVRMRDEPEPDIYGYMRKSKACEHGERC